MPITPLPASPSRARPATFSSEADALLSALPTMVSEFNASMSGESAAALALNIASGASGKGADLVGHTGTSNTVADKLSEFPSSNDAGAANDGVTDDTSAINTALASVGVAYTSSDWWTKHGHVTINKGNRIAVGSYQSTYTGIIQFNELTWPVNATVHFNAGSGESVQHKNNIADGTTPVNEWRYEAPYHPALILNQRTAASYTETQPAHSLGSATAQLFTSILFQQDTKDRFQLTGDHSTDQLWIKSFRPSDEAALSKVWQIDAETGSQAIQATAYDSTDGSALVVGGKLKIRGGSGAINGQEANLEATLYLHNGTSGSKGALQMDDGTGAIEIQRLAGATEGAVLLKVGGGSGFWYQHTYSGLPATAAALKLGKNSTTGVSIITSGAITSQAVTVASLPAASTLTGMRAFVTDSTVAAAGNFGAAVAGGGANKVPVHSDGASWRIG